MKHLPLCIMMSISAPCSAQELRTASDKSAQAIVADLKKDQLVLACYELSIDKSPTGGYVNLVLAKPDEAIDWDGSAPLRLSPNDYIALARSIAKEKLKKGNSFKKLKLSEFSIKPFEWDTMKKYVKVSFASNIEELNQEPTIYLDLQGEEMNVRKMNLNPEQVHSILENGLQPSKK